MTEKIALEPSTIKQPAIALGVWSAILATGFTTLFILLAFVFTAAEWSDIEAYASTFDSLEMAQFIPLILLAPTVVILMACIHYVTPESRKVFGLIGIAFSSVYAAIISTNYYIQLFVVRLNLLNAELEGLNLLVMPNPHSIFVALETIGYAFLSLAMLFISPVFTGGKLERWIRRVFVFGGVMGVFSAIVAPFDQPPLFYTGFGLSLLAFPIGTVLVSIFFKRYELK